MELKKFLKPWSFIFGQDLTTSFNKFLTFFDVERAYKDELVIRVDRISNVATKENFEDRINLVNPLSVNFMHFDRFKCLNEFKNWLLDSEYKVSLDISVQLKSKNSKFLIVEDITN